MKPGRSEASCSEIPSLSGLTPWSNQNCRPSSRLTRGEGRTGFPVIDGVEVHVRGHREVRLLPAAARGERTTPHSAHGHESGHSEDG